MKPSLVRPYDAAEDQLLELLKNAIQEGVFTEGFRTELRKILK